jgi:hypothetical protein
MFGLLAENVYSLPKNRMFVEGFAQHGKNSHNAKDPLLGLLQIQT